MLELNVLVFVLATFCWTKSLPCKVAAFTGKLPYPESTLQPCPSRRFCEAWKQVYFGSLLTIRTTWYSVRTLINQQHPSGRQDLFRPDIHQCLEAHQSSRRSQCSSASVRMTWLYHSGFDKH